MSIIVFLNFVNTLLVVTITLYILASHVSVQKKHSLVLPLNLKLKWRNLCHGVNCDCKCLLTTTSRIVQFFVHATCVLPNQELSVLYGGPTLTYGEQLSLYVPYMPRVSMTGDLAHLQLSDLQGETRPVC